MNDLTFLKEIEKASGEKVSACYQCYRCTNGCPVAAEMDVYPHRIIRHIILGDREKVLKSKTVWTCLQCATCSIRCPNDINIAHVFETLRKIAAAENTAPDKATWTFDKLFLENVRKHGRLHELEVVMKYKLAMKDLFGDVAGEMKMGLGMMTKGRMGLLPHNIKNRAALKEVFKKLEAAKEREGA